MAERLSSEQAARLERRCAAAERMVERAKERYEATMAERARVFLECFESGLTIPEVAAAASKSVASVHLDLAKARKARAEGQQPAATA